MPREQSELPRLHDLPHNISKFRGFKVSYHSGETLKLEALKPESGFRASKILATSPINFLSAPHHDFRTALRRPSNIIFCLTSLFIDSIHSDSRNKTPLHHP